MIEFEPIEHDHSDLSFIRCKYAGCRAPSTTYFVLGMSRPIMMLRLCTRHADWIRDDQTGKRLVACIDNTINRNHYQGIWTARDWHEVGFEKWNEG